MNIINYQLSNIEKLQSDLIFLFGDDVSTRGIPFLQKNELTYIFEHRKDDPESLVVLHRYNEGHCTNLYVQSFNPSLPTHESWEKLRKAAAQIQQQLQKNKTTQIAITGAGVLPEDMMAFLEGLTLANYRFDKYKKKKDTLLSTITVDDRFLSQNDLDTNVRLWQHINECRDWVNEPVMYLNADKFARIIVEEANRLRVKVTVLEQSQIESLKMGGLLAVNRGSVDEARFVVLEYKSEVSINHNPIALVGKGIMYDTGGLNIKPDEYMQEMKSDMAGAATMAATLFAAAENKLPVHLMAFLPLTDNRPSGNAYAADDILTMYDGTTVEVINTDAEGRLILADAIAYANQFNPELIIDAATLTGAAVRAIGTFGIAAMQQNADNPMNLLKIVGNQVYERIAEFPFWQEYDELIKSEVADIKNCGIPQAGTITAGKFLAHFAHAPYIHLDIAGVAYFPKYESFYGVGASGYAIRLLYAFLQTYDVLNGK